MIDQAKLVQELEWRARENPARPRVMVIGIGGLGLPILNGLVRLGSDVEVIAAGRDVTRVQIGANLAVFSAMQSTNNVARVQCVALDLLNSDATAETLASLRPDLILHCATMQPYAEIAALPAESRSILSEVGLGPWLPAHLALADRLMKVLKALALPALVVNCAYPDAVNPALASVGRAPLIGIGNIANNEPALRRAIADELKIDVSAVSLWMVMHHYVSHRIHRHGDAGGAPFYFSYEVDSGERGSEVKTEHLFSLIASRYRREHAHAGKQLPAASAVALVTALLGSTIRRMHAPAPFGFAGGFPVEVSRQSVSIVAPPGLTTQNAIDINTTGQRFDGIEKIGADGLITFTDEVVAVFDKILGHHCSQFHVDDAREWALELTARCKERGTT